MRILHRLGWVRGSIVAVGAEPTADSAAAAEEMSVFPGCFLSFS